MEGKKYRLYSFAKIKAFTTLFLRNRLPNVIVITCLLNRDKYILPCTIEVFKYILLFEYNIDNIVFEICNKRDIRLLDVLNKF